MKITTMTQLGRTLGVPGSRSLCLWSQLEWDLPCLPLQPSSTLQLADLTLWWLVDHFLSGENGGDWKSTSLVRRFPQRGWQGRWSQTLWSKCTASVWSEWHVWVISITDILIWSSVILTTIRMMVILVIMVISMPVMVIRMICMYAGDHSASDQHHGDQGTVCMLVISATFGKLLHSEFGSINTLLPPTCVSHHWSMRIRHHRHH